MCIQILYILYFCIKSIVITDNIHTMHRRTILQNQLLLNTSLGLMEILKHSSQKKCHIQYSYTRINPFATGNIPVCDRRFKSTNYARSTQYAVRCTQETFLHDFLLILKQLLRNYQKKCSLASHSIKYINLLTHYYIEFFIITITRSKRVKSILA